MWITGLLIACLFSIAPFANVTAQTGTASFERKLRRDAARLTLRAMVEKGDNGIHDIEIPQKLCEEYYKILLGIYEKQPVAKALEECNLHTSPEPSVDHLVLIIKKNAAWAAPLKNGKGLTGNLEFNALLKKHSIKASLVNWDDDHDAVTLNSDRPLNIAALETTISSLEKIVDTGKIGYKSQGNDIIAKRNSSGWEVTYLFRFGSQFGNASKEHRWVFQYNLSGNVTLINESGDILPDWMPCQLVR